MIFVKRDNVTPPTSLTAPKGKGCKEKTMATAFYAALAALPAPVQPQTNTAKKKKPKTTYTFRAYQAPDVKEKLEKLFHKKCAYCESDYRAVMSAQVEHFRPKSRVAEDPTHTGYWWLASEWTNLLPSCIHCNGSQYHEVRMFNAEQPYTQKIKKGAYKLGKYDAFPIGGTRAVTDGDDLDREDAYLIDPTRRHPDRHLRWIVEGSLSLIAPLKAGNSWDPYGLATYRTFGLNRVSLVQARSELMLEIENQLQKAEQALWLAASTPPGRFFNYLNQTAKGIFDALEARTSPSKPYSAMVKSLIGNHRARMIADFESALARSKGMGSLQPGLSQSGLSNGRKGSMIPGYVYVLVNPSMPGLIKIGRTLRDPRTRARELSSTGVPTPFQVAFELFSEDHQELERMMHRALEDFRVDTAREFFRYPLDKTIKLLLEMSDPNPNPSTSYVAEDITQRLREKYPAHLRPDIAAIRIVQEPGRVWLEITTEEEIAGYLVDQTIKRTDLAFISDLDKPFFSPEDSIRINASKLVEDYDAYSIIMTTDLFHDEV